MKIHDKVKVLRDFPRLHIRAGDTAEIAAEKAPHIFEIVIRHDGLIPSNIVVLEEWIEAL